MAFAADSTMLSIAIIAMIFLVPRLSIILPAKALGSRDITIRKIWHASRGQTWRLAIGALLTYVPSLPVIALYYAATSRSQTQFDFAFFKALFYFTSTILNLVFVGFITFAYRHLVEQDARRLASVFLPT
jgi:hypothetical protein